jgi:hypothetical protein
MEERNRSYGFIGQLRDLTGLSTAMRLSSVNPVWRDRIPSGEMGFNLTELNPVLPEKGSSGRI